MLPAQAQIVIFAGAKLVTIYNDSYATTIGDKHRFRAQCLNQHWFLTLADARAKREAWLRYDTEDRPHGAIGYKAPIELANPGNETGHLPR